jgi:hypothetical protein
LLSYPAHAGYPVLPIFVIGDICVYWIARSLCAIAHKAGDDG